MGLLDDLSSPPKERYAMPHVNVVRLIWPGTFDDQLTEVLRNGARALLAQAVEAEVAGFLAKHADLKTEEGHRRVVRHGHLPEREVMTGIGPMLSASRQCVIERRRPMIPGASASRRRSCRPTCVDRSRSRRRCRSCTSRVSRPAISRMLWQRCWARTRAACRRPSSGV